MKTLKPCPFCGGEAIIAQTGCGTADLNSVRLDFRIRCKKCEATAPRAFGSVFVNLSSDGLNIWHDEREDAIKEWNKRAKNNDNID